MSIREKMLRLDGKGVAVGFAPSRPGLGSLQVWGVLHVVKRRPFYGVVTSFKSGTVYILEPCNVEFIGELKCSPSEIAYR